MRELKTIQTREKLNQVYATDEKGKGNANHSYLVCSEEYYEDTAELLFFTPIKFQNGARKDKNAVNGVIDSDLLEIVRDRLKGFQSGEFKSEYNEKALEHIELALMYLNRRVEDRIEREVLGKYEK